jgi:hypothetical protein
MAMLRLRFCIFFLLKNKKAAQVSGLGFSLSICCYICDENPSPVRINGQHIAIAVCPQIREPHRLLRLGDERLINSGQVIQPLGDCKSEGSTGLGAANALLTAAD